MAITVRTDSDIDTYSTAEKWHVDEHGYLHIVNPSGKGNIASYRAGTWETVFENRPLASSESEKDRDATLIP